MNINSILTQYHNKFDDSKVRELLEELAQMMHERAEFFSNFDHNENKDMDKKTSDNADNYWSSLDDLAYGSNMHDEILDKLQHDVQGMSSCWCCRKIAPLRTKLVASIPTDNMYLVKMCKQCHSEKHVVARYGKNKVDVDTKAPADLSEHEKEIMTSFQKSLRKSSQ